MNRPWVLPLIMFIFITFLFIGVNAFMEGNTRFECETFGKSKYKGEWIKCKEEK